MHVGAHKGEERFYCLKNNLNVFWIEANPRIFRELKRNLRLFPNQKAIRGVVGESSNQEVSFKVTNQTASSSYLDLNDVELFPELRIDWEFKTYTTSLEEIVVNHAIDLDEDTLLVIDTQGSEFAILKGSKNILGRFRYIVLETQDFQFYRNQGLSDEIETFLASQGFCLIEKEVWAENSKGNKRCFNLIFKNQSTRI